MTSDDKEAEEKEVWPAKGPWTPGVDLKLKDEYKD